MSFSKILDIVINYIKIIFQYFFKNKDNTLQVLQEQPKVLPIQQPVNTVEPKAEKPEQPVITLSAPPRSNNSLTGSQFSNTLLYLNIFQRNEKILQEYINGNIPDFQRILKPITVKDQNNTITYYIIPEVLCIGINEDYVRLPMTPGMAQKIADLYQCTLPTKKMSKDIALKADIKLSPTPLGAPYDGTMSSMKRILEHEAKINSQLKSFVDCNGKVITGHKKDIVITNSLAPNNPNRRVAIFGWFYPFGTFIQPLNAISHDSNYLDYSHSVRLIHNQVIVNNNQMDINDVFNHQEYSKLISDEGVVRFKKYSY